MSGKYKTYSPEYMELNRLLHEDQSVSYGRSGCKHLDRVLAVQTLFECESVLDYGCGKGTLDLPGIERYDPAIPQFSKYPDPAHLVVCTDVMEHIEPEYVGNAILDIYSLTKRVAYFQIATRKDKSKTLPDGTNPHKTVRKANWWLGTFKEVLGDRTHKIVTLKLCEEKRRESLSFLLVKQ
jgi:hypothetical protein